jgi:two-component system, NarL family, sensor kinase
MGIPDGIADPQLTSGVSFLIPSSEPRSAGDSQQPSALDAFQQLIDALPEQIALMDEDWIILAVNKAWAATAALYGYDTIERGSNYAEFCRIGANQGHDAAASAVEGMRQIDAGLRSSFDFLYEGSDPWAGQMFRLAINRMVINGRTVALVTRSDMTEVVQLRILREGFSHSLIEGRAEERRRMAREIHDSTLQLLASLGLGLGQVKRSAGTSNKVLQIVGEMEGVLAEAFKEIRSISYLSHPPPLEKWGLSVALEMLVAGFERRTGLATSLSVDQDACVPWAPARATIYRVVQEALSNAYRHAHATTIDVRLRCRRSLVHAVVVDDGIGMAAAVDQGVGIPGMQARVAELGGRLFVRHLPRGIAIIASLPREEPRRAVR